jgi:hypothetical protein
MRNKLLNTHHNGAPGVDEFGAVEEGAVNVAFVFVFDYDFETV